MIDLNIQQIYNGHFNILYRGVPTIKCPFDYVLLQMILNEIEPDLIIEIGAAYGGSALYMADILDKIGKGTIHTIDVQDRITSNLVLNNPRIKRFLSGGYETYPIDILSKYKDGTILVIDDGSHMYEDVKKALEKFKNIECNKLHLIVEDGNIIDTLGIREGFNNGPTVAIEEFIELNSNFYHDSKWTNFFGNASFNGIGYLARK